MKAIINVTQSDDGKLAVDVEYTVAETNDIDGKRTINSLELAMCEFIRDIAIGVVRPDLRHIFDTPVNLLDEFSAAHDDVVKRMKRGDFGDGTMEENGVGR